MRTECNRFFSILLTLAMVLGMIPAVSAPATATDEVTPIEAASPIQLCEQLNALGDAYIQLQPRDTPEYTDRVWKTQMPTLQVYGNKILDLNGVTVEKRYSNDTLAPEAVMVIVNEGASLTIIDSRGGGGLSIVSTNLLDTKSEFEENPPVRDLFHVDGGTLIINGGTFTAGNSEDFWVTWGAKLYDTSASSYCGNIHYQTTGSVVTLNNGSTFVANGGHFEGRGYIKYPTYRKDEIIRNSTVKTDGTGNHVYINAGTFKGMGGANVFSLGANDQIDVRGGSFSLHHHKRLWCYDTDHYAYYYNADKGLIGLDNFWVAAGNVNYLPYVMKAKWNNTVWSGHDTASTKHDFMMTGAHFDGDVITYLPSPYTLPGGNLSLNGKASAEGYWNINQSAYVSCDVRTYYQQTDTIPEHRLTYTWTIKDGDGNAVSTNITDTNQLNLSTNWANGRDELVISCQVEESGPSGTWGYFSKPITIHLSDLPLSEAKLPDGGIELDVEYGKTTKNDDYAVITVRPDQATVEDAFRFVDSVEYSLAYTDILGQSATAKINNGSYFIIETEAGDTKATLTMTLTDIYGKESTFTESVWLLRLPEITVTANTLRESGGRYIITAGDSTAKLSVSDLDADHFYRWYNSTAQQEVGTDMTVSISQSGVYTYNYWNHDKTKLLTSAPVTIDFTNYFSVTKKSADAVYFYAPEDSGKPTDSVLTIELGDGFNKVSKPSVQWVLKSYPAGGKYAIKTETLDPNAITMQSGFPVNFCDFLDDSNGFVLPGDYVVQPVITFDTVDNTGLTAYGDVVTVTVHKYVDEIKPTANGKVIEDNSVITLPVGKSLDLSWMIGKYSEYDTANSAWYIDMGEYAEDTVVIEGETSGSTYQGNIKLTAKKPGQVKVRMSGSAAKDGLDDYMSGGVHNFTVNIPVTEFEVTMAEPVENAASGSDYFKTPEGALYTANTIWLNEQQAASGKFIPGIVSRANVHLTVAEGYALPEDLSDITLKINGEVVSLADVEYPSITTEDFRFVYNFGQLVFDKDIIEGQDIEFPIPAVGDAVDQYPNSNNNTALFGETGGLKMWADWLNIVEPNDGDDGNFTNDTSTEVSDDDVYEEGNTYRLTMSVSLYNGYVLGESFVPTVNGSKVEHDFSFGDTSFRAYYYFTPRALVDEILLELPSPAAMDQPTSLEMLNDGSNLVYPSSIQWFIDANTNGKLDEKEGEGTADDFNADGSFKSNTAYSMMVIMNVYDRDYDGVGDDAAFADTITVKHDDESGADASEIECTITKVADDATVIGICHTFAPTGTQDYALVANPNELTFNVVEGYTSVKPQTFTVESLGSETISAEQLTIFNETGCFEITRNGYQFTVQPLMGENGMPTTPGTYEFDVSVYYDDETSGERIWANVIVHFNVAEAYVDLAVEPESLTFSGVEGYESIDSKSFQIKNVGNYDGFYINTSTITVRNESPKFEVKHEGDTVTVTPVQGLTEGTHEATLLVMANNYNIVVPVPITFTVQPRPEYGLEITPQTYPLEALIGYGEDTCAEFEIKSTGKNKLTAEDLKVQIRENASPENFVFNRYELTDTPDGNMLLKVYPKTGCQPALGEEAYVWWSSVSLYAERTVTEGDDSWEEYLAGTSASITFVVEWPSYSIATRPAEVEFSANKGYTDVSEIIRVFSDGTSEITAIRANVYEVTGGLSENFTATVDGMNVTVTPVAGLAAGEYKAGVEIRDVDGLTSTTVSVTFTVTDYQITVSPESFSFSGKEGDDFYFDADYTATATNGGDPVELMAELEGFEGKAWEGGFALSAPDGVGNEIPAGTYTGYLVLSIPDTDYSKKVPITVTIEAVDYRLSVEPGTLDFKLLEGYQAADAKTVTVTSIGADAVSDITVALPTNTPVEPPVTISVAASANGSKIVTVTPKTGLDKGTYTTEICIGSESGLVDTITVPVTITVDGYTYGMKADVEELVFPTALEGYQTVESKTVIITSTGTGAITQLEEVYFKFESDQPDSKWFTVTTDGMTVTVTPAAGMARNIYRGWLMISAKGELISIPVTFEVACDHNWQVTVLVEPELGKHGMKHSVCTICKQDAGIEEIPALEVCPHACMNCGGCRKTAPCNDTTHCECDEPGPVMKHTDVNAQILETLNPELNLELVAEEISNENVPEDELHPYEKYVVDHVQGYMVETIYDISLRLNGAHYDLPDGESVTVRLDVGKEAAKKLDSGNLYLIHITSKGRVIYGTQKGQTPLTVEKYNGDYTGFISFETSEFSPFVLASVPEDPEIKLTAKETATGCTVTLESNVATTGHLYLAVYDTSGKMLSVDVISNFTFGLDSTRTFDMAYSGTAARVKGFLIQDYTFSPKHTALDYPF